ncbi:IkappaB kinase complex IKAP component [Epithele typhae]|uniref:IkappaB kinase complex IKAP component n=1 Tax=Epithele typhae TaxID=378194 RepID=UPI0020074239|nr:IkappaB kinase complex IKAP component [Epithele typhae]KAH9935182.1 IkappaB kinase complex IKAP component [Epithele typhae]
MRNLSLWKTAVVSLPEVEFSSSDGSAEPKQPKESASRSVTAIALDLDQNAILVATEHKSASSDGEVSVTIWNLSNDPSKVQVTELTTFTTPTLAASNPWAGGSTSTRKIPQDAWHDPEVLSLHVVPDEHTLVAVTRAGDIVTIPLDDDAPTAEVVGSIDGGVMGAGWSPDDTVLVLVTGEDKLILMTPTFDILWEGPLHPTDFGEDAPINVGWGSKQTQFHGSAGKSAAASTVPIASVGASPDDDGHARVSWRGDGAFFAVSVLEGANETETRPHRRLRVYSRDGALQSTAEPVAGLEHGMAWRPSGGLIASTQRFGRVPGAPKEDGDAGLGQGRDGRHDVVFFERNGLRHGEFGLREGLPVKDQSGREVQPKASDRRRWGYRVREVAWSADSNVLSVWLEREGVDVGEAIDLANGHRYLKQEITASSISESISGRFTNVKWHPEDPLYIIVTTATHILLRTYSWDTCSSQAAPPSDSGSVSVIDGINALLTPFRTQNVPPPMAAHTLAFDALSNHAIQPPVFRNATPVHAAFSHRRDLLAVLWEYGVLCVYDLHTRLVPGRGKVMEPELLWTTREAHDGCRQVVVLDDDPTQPEKYRFAILGGGLNEDWILDVGSTPSLEKSSYVHVPRNMGRLAEGSGRDLFWQAPDGRIHRVDTEKGHFDETAKLPEFCFWSASVAIFNRLYVADGHTSLTLASNVNSFTLTPGFLIYATTAHLAHFAPIKTLVATLARAAEAPDNPVPEFETRRVERGSRIVTTVPSAMNLVLQMPRGNLETISPRPLVLEVVHQDIASGNYAKAFASCRKHRVDPNVFVEHDQEVFIKGIPSFIEQVADVDYINLFLTSLGQGSLSSELVAQICDTIRVELERIDLKKYVNSILTAHVVKRPPDHEAGLALLLRLKESEPNLVEDAVKYIIFLVDADKLFDTALGMYDFSLVLMVAQHAQKDPREYLPFLRELRAMDHHYQRFRIDDHLKRYDKALTGLYLAGPERFKEAMTYVENHQLYEPALSLWRDSDKWHTVLFHYGTWLWGRNEHREAAFVFRQANEPREAMKLHEKALDWQELFELAVHLDVPEDELKDIAYRVAEALTSKKRTADAARVLLDYAKDVREATIALVEGGHFSEARRIIALHREPQLLDEIVHPGTLECRARIGEELGEMREQLRKQLQRVRELRVRKVEEPDAFYGVEDADLHNVDVMTDASMAPTAFTRYTVAPSAMSKTSSKRSSRSKRKLERKVGSGRKGTSVSKLVTRFQTAQTDSSNVLPHLLQFTDEHRAEAASLQHELEEFAKELNTALEDIWTKTPDVEEGPTSPRCWAARMEAHEKRTHVNPVDNVPKPELPKQEWKLRLPSSRVGGGVAA